MNPIYRCQYLFHHWWWWWTVFVVWLTSRNHCQRSSLLQFFGTTQVGFEPAQNMSSNFVEWSCAILITTSHGVTSHCIFFAVGHITKLATLSSSLLQLFIIISAASTAEKSFLNVETFINLFKLLYFKE